MKKLFSLLCLLMFFTSSYTQQNEDDINSLSIFSEYAKAKNYDAAYAPWMELRNRNPKFNSAIYSLGRKNFKGQNQKLFCRRKSPFYTMILYYFGFKKEKISPKKLH